MHELVLIRKEREKEKAASEQREHELAVELRKAQETSQLILQALEQAKIDERPPKSNSPQTHSPIVNLPSQDLTSKHVDSSKSAVPIPATPTTVSPPQQRSNSISPHDCHVRYMQSMYEEAMNSQEKESELQRTKADLRRSEEEAAKAQATAHRLQWLLKIREGFP